MKIPNYRMWHINNRIDVRYDLYTWALPIHIRHDMNFCLGLKETIIGFLCFEIRIMQRR